ncbi:MAG: D-alanyl-D-alanine carboxypeptidase/D-alanyl-D-alanine endopeptidase [Candidatus Acidiferrales bacterium]
MTRNRFLLLMGACLLAVQALPAQSNSALAARIDKIIGQPEYRHAQIGIEIYSLDKQEVLYALDANKLFLPASTTKLMTEGTALNLLGPGFRFHTRVYHTGTVLPDGILQGDIVLVAAGDPNLSARVQPDDTLSFENWDHSLSGNPATRAVPGDPLKVIREIARQIAEHGIKKITGRVIIDTSLYPEGQREPGTGTAISPIAVNDNLVDIMIGPGSAVGSPATLTMSPATSYVHLLSRVTTGKADSQIDIGEGSDVENSDGSRTVAVVGNYPLRASPILFAYPVPVPSRFAETCLVAALQQEGVEAQLSAPGEKFDFKKLSANYLPDKLVAEHISPPFSQEIKVTLKVSQNLHAAMTPFLLGATLGHKTVPADQAGFDLERNFLEKAGLDLAGAAQSAGEGNPSYFSPDFVVHYLTYMTTTKYYPIFLHALPVLNKDGTLYNILPGSPAEGHVFAKTGTTGTDDKLNRRLIVTSKGLAGYETTASGEHLVFAIYVNNLSIPRTPFEESAMKVGSMLTEIAAAAYDIR